MASKGVVKTDHSTEDDYRGVLGKASGGTGWALCIGAGTSVGVFPDWNNLAKDLLRKVHGGPSEQALDSFIKDFGPGALMQAVSNFSSNRSSIPELLSETLYAPLRKHSGKSWEIVAQA